MGYENAKIIRIIPDQEGRGGSKTSLTSQSVNLDIRLASNVVVNYGRWRQATQAIIPDDIPGFPDVQRSYSLHDFAFYDTSNANLPPLDRILSHVQTVDGLQVIGQHNPIQIVKIYTAPDPTDTLPATFSNIKNRCFICWAATNNFIYTGKLTYDVGVDAPVTAATYTLGSIASQYAFATAGGTRVSLLQNVATPITNAVRYVTIAGRSYATQQPNPLFTGPYPNPGTATGTSPNFTVTINSPTAWPVFDYNGLKITIDGLDYYIIGYTITGTNMTVTLSWALGTSPTNAPYTISGTQIILGTPFLGNTTKNVTDTGFGLVTSDTVVQAFDGPLFWDNPPQYAYAYYDSPFMIEGGTASGTAGTNQIVINAVWGAMRYIGAKITLGGETLTIQSYLTGPTTTVTTIENLANTYPPGTEYTLSGQMYDYGTGHVSNCSPHTFVTEKNQNAVSVVLSNIIPSRQEDQGRFNKILIFRGLLNGGGAPLFPFDFSVGMIPNTGTTPLTFEDVYDDSFLLQTEPGFQEPGAGDNRKPRPFAHQAYWDGRLWGNPVDDPSAIVYSGDSGQILFGVPEECFPSGNILRVPSDDGRVTGMTLMGPLVIIATERYAYYIAGSGSVANPYRPVRFSTLMYGVGDKQMIEFAGTTTDDSDLLLYVGKDRRFYLTAPAVGNVTISDPVQDNFTLGIGQRYDLVRLSNVAISGNHYLMVALGWTYSLMIYDWNRKVWYNHNPQQPDLQVGLPQAFCTVYGLTNPVRFLYTINGIVYELLGDNNTVGVQVPQQPFVETMPLLATDRKSRKQINFIRIYVSDPGEKDADGNYIKPWQMVMWANEIPQIVRNFSEYEDPLLTIQPPGALPIDFLNSKELICVPQIDDKAITQGYRFTFRVLWPDSATVRDLYAIDICYTDLEPGDQASI